VSAPRPAGLDALGLDDASLDRALDAAVAEVGEDAVQRAAENLSAWQVTSKPGAVIHVEEHRLSPKELAALDGGPGFARALRGGS